MPKKPMKKRVYRKPVVAKKLKTAVQSVINKNLELKNVLVRVDSWEEKDDSFITFQNPYHKTIMQNVGQSTNFAENNRHNRIGNDIRLVRIKGRWTFNNATATHQMIRCIFYRPRVIGQLLEPTFNCFKPIDTDLFEVRFDKVFTSYVGNAVHVLTIDEDFRDKTGRGQLVQYSGTEGNSIKTNDWRIAFLTTSNGVADPAQFVYQAGYIKVHFQDA